MRGIRPHWVDIVIVYVRAHWDDWVKNAIPAIGVLVPFAGVLLFFVVGRDTTVTMHDGTAIARHFDPGAGRHGMRDLWVVDIDGLPQSIEADGSRYSGAFEPGRAICVRDIGGGFLTARYFVEALAPCDG